MVNCCICNLEPGVLANVEFFSPPVDVERREKWMSIIGRHIDSNSRVCERHFLSSEYIYVNRKRLLLPSSVPSVKIMNNKTADDISRERALSSNGNIILSQCSGITQKTYIIIKKLKNDKIDNIKEHNYSETDNIEEFESKDANCSDTQNQEVESEYEVHYMTIDELYAIGDNQNTGKQILKRKKKVQNAPQKRKCSRNPRYVGDLTREDFTSNASWNIVNNFVQDSRKEQEFLTKTLNQLSDKVKSVDSLLNEAKKRPRAKSVLKNV